MKIFLLVWFLQTPQHYYESKPMDTFEECRLRSYEVQNYIYNTFNKAEVHTMCIARKVKETT